MSRKQNIGLVKMIAREIVAKGNYSLGTVEFGDSKKSCAVLYRGGKPAAMEKDIASLVRGCTDIDQDVGMKVGRLKPETLGVIISVGAAVEEGRQGLAMSDVAPLENCLFHANPDGGNILNAFAGLCLAAAVWDILIAGKKTEKAAGETLPQPTI